MSKSVLGGVVTLAVLGLAIHACSDFSSSSPKVAAASFHSDASAESSDSDDVDEDRVGSTREPFDEDAAREEAEAELASSSYTGEGAAYGCTDDCSGHEAGWQYRADQGYAGSNPDSPSFDEGGRAFDEAVDEKVDEARSAYEADEASDD